MDILQIRADIHHRRRMPGCKPLWLDLSMTDHYSTQKANNNSLLKGNF